MISERTVVVVPVPDEASGALGHFADPPELPLLVSTVTINGAEHRFRSIRTAPTATMFCQWRAELPTAGRYEVAVFVPSNHATATRARYFVHGAQNRSGPVEAFVNQEVVFNAWVPLGIFEFDPASEADVRVEAQNGSDENPAREMAFDVVRWVLVEGWVWPVEGGQRRIGHPFNEFREDFAANHLHEGVDLPAAEGTPIVSVVPGIVVAINPNTPADTGYGNNLRVAHDDGSGFEVRYAHFSEFEPGLEVGQRVEAGQRLGLAGHTGNVFPKSAAGAHLHVNLTHPVHGLSGYVAKFVMDPEPFLRSLIELAGPGGVPGRRITPPPVPEPEPEPEPGPAGDFARLPDGLHALAGLHGPADPGNFFWTQAAFDVVRDTGVAAVKVQVSNQDTITADTANRLREHARLLLARLVVPLGDHPAGTDAFAFLLNEIDGGSQALARAVSTGIQFFEVHNEPNLSDEGCFAHWQNGAEFAEFFIRVLNRLRERFPGVQFGFPGVSPGGELAGIVLPDGRVRGKRAPSDRFLEQAAPAIRAADFLCTHVYWGGDGSTFEQAVAELRATCERFPDKVVFATEFSNNHREVPKEQKAEQYLAFYRAVRALPPNLGAVFSYCLSASDPTFAHEAWLDGGGFTPIAAGLRPHSGFLRG
jgi:hypothetical protein